MNSESRNVPERVRTIYRTTLLDSSCIASARERLEQYKEAGVVLAGCLEDDVILVTDQRARYLLDFSPADGESYASNWEGFYGLSFRPFLTYLKCGIILKLGEVSLATLRGTVSDFMRSLSVSPEDLEKSARKGDISHPGAFIDIFLRLPVKDGLEAERDMLADRIDNAAFDRPAARRELPDFKSCLIADSILKDYWPGAPEDQKTVLWPFYIAWSVTMIIPTRPIEILLTPADCLYQKEDGGWMLRLRKSIIKGRNDGIGYSIDKDFSLSAHPIPDWIAQSILDYQGLLRKKHIKAPHLGTLFSPELHSIGMGQRRTRSPYYTYGLYTCACRFFFSEVVEKAYGYHVYYGPGMPEEQMPEDWTSYIRPGDARHFSLINMAASKVPIEVMMCSAGHSTAAQNVHYAGNQGTYDKSPTHRAFLEMKSRLVSLVPIAAYDFQPKEGDPFVELDEGRCYSPRFLNDDASDCVRSCGENGELGWCAACPFFRNSNPTLTISDCSHLLKSVEDDWRLLREMVDSYRLEFVGGQEAILRTVLRLQEDGDILRRYLDRQTKMKRDEVKNGSNNEEGAP